VAVKPAGESLDAFLTSLGTDGRIARDLDSSVEAAMSSLVSLSAMTSALAIDYLTRLARPIPELTPATGAFVIGRAYMAHVVVESDPQRFGAVDVPVLGTLPSLRRSGAPPQDLLLRVVKATRRGFEVIRAVSGPVWNGFVRCLATKSQDVVGGDEPIALEVIDGLARVGWVLRQVDIHYGLAPQRR
jgi:hypothetical protein